LYGKTKSIGEVTAPNFLNIRTSIIGPNPIRKTGLLEWFLSQPKDGEVYGFTDKQWNGVTTLQFAELCKILILDDYFDTVYAESPIHHFCPNQSKNKYELLKLFRFNFRPDLTVIPQVNIKKAVSRILDTNYQSISAKFGNNILLKEAIKALASVMK
jgi:dTDP-4-dehydrorhamnose reductase